MSRVPEDIDSGDDVREWDRFVALEDGTECFQDGKRGRHLAAKHPSWTSSLIGRKIYQCTMAIVREYGNDTDGRKINSRKTAGRSAKLSWASKGETGNRSQ